MLSLVRRTAKSWAAGLILLLALVAIVITGFGTGGFGGIGSLGTGQAGGAALASADGRTLTEQEVTDILNRQYSQARQQQPDLDMATYLNEAFTPIVDQLVMALAIQVYGAEQGLVANQTMVDREIVNIPAFRNFAGQFDDATFRQALAGQNITEAQLREDIARSLMQRQLLGPVARGASVPEGIAREYANLLLERRRGTIGVVPAELLRAGIAPTDAEVAAFYNGNRGRFTIPERRVIRYAAMGPEQAGAAATATEAEIAAFYRQNAANFGPSETRNLQSIVLPDQAAAQAFAQRVRAGTSFVQAASQAGFRESDVALDNQNREQFGRATSSQVAQAAFGAQQGAVIGPIRSELGFHIVRVEAINRIPGRPLEAVRAQIAQQIELRKRADALADLVARVEDKLSEGASLEEVARSERLSLVTTPPMTETGQVPGQQWVVPAELRPLLQSAFELDAEEPEPVVEEIEANRRFALVGVERVVPAAPPPLAQIRDQVRTALIDQRALERARALADGIAGRINRGTPAAQAFAQAQPRLPSPQDVNLQRMEISQGGQQVPPPLLALFSLPQGRAHVLAAPNNAGWFIVHHVQRTPGNASGQPQLIATTRAGFANSAGEEIAQQFARAIERDVGVERDAAAISATQRRLMGDAAVE